MKINQVKSFRLFDRRNSELVIVSFTRRDDCFFLEKRKQSGEVIDSEKVDEIFAQTVLEQALICLPKEDVEIEKLSTGISFNYPIAHV